MNLLRQVKSRAGQGASNRTARRINSSLVLSAVRTRQPISRVQLARVLGLQPSTVSLIVEELLRSEWILEGEAVKAARGRRPRLLRISDQRCVVAVDIHPREATIALTEISGRIAWQTLISLPVDPQKAVDRITAAIQKTIELHAEHNVEGIGICLPGRTDQSAKELVFAPNLHWPTVRLKEKVERATGLRVEMDNVANACALSEVWFSGGVADQNLVVVEVSEGIGTGIFSNGALIRGRGGMAGEFGHIQIVENGLLCGCGNYGCWETVASNQAAIRFFAHNAADAPPATFSEILRQALANEPNAIDALQQMARNLGRGMRMIAAALAPDEVVVVGEITSAWHIIGHLVESEMRLHPLAKNVRLRPAYDGASARLRSAVALVFTQAFSHAEATTPSIKLTTKATRKQKR